MAWREGRARREKIAAVPPLALEVAEWPGEGGRSAAFHGFHVFILENYIPLQPFSVKFTDDERAKLKALASALGGNEGKVVRDSDATVIYLVGIPRMKCCPKSSAWRDSRST